MESSWRRNVSDLGWAGRDILRIARYLDVPYPGPTCSAATPAQYGQVYGGIHPGGTSKQWWVLPPRPGGAGLVRCTGSETIDNLVAIEFLEGEACQITQTRIVPELGGCVQIAFTAFGGLTPYILVEDLLGSAPPVFVTWRVDPVGCGEPGPPLGLVGQDLVFGDLLMLFGDLTSWRVRERVEPLFPDVMFLDLLSVETRSWTELASTGVIEAD